MKNVFLLFFIVSLSNVFGQTNDDFKAIVDLTISKFNKDSVFNIYDRFNNKNLLNKIKKSNSEVVKLKDITFNAKTSKRTLRKYRNSKIAHFASNMLKKSDDKPIVYISSPIISTNNLKAVVYVKQLFAGFTGSWSYFIFEYKNGSWELKETKLQRSVRGF